MKNLNELNKKVKAGAAFLDVVKPNWHKKIDTETLDLRNRYVCVLGQLYDEYYNGKDTLGLTGTFVDNLGFYGTKRQCPQLTKLWVALVKKLQKLR